MQSEAQKNEKKVFLRIIMRENKHSNDYDLLDSGFGRKLERDIFFSDLAPLFSLSESQ